MLPKFYHDKKTILHAVKLLVQNNEIMLILICLSIISVVAFSYYYSIGINALYGDALSRLNISRKIVDNLTPGFGQLGNVWLPLTQLLMLPFIWNNFMWHSGIAGSIVSMIAFIFGGVCIYKSGKLLTGSSFASTMALCLYALNINVLYMQTTSMSEVLFISFSAAVMFYLIRWTQTHNLTDLIKTAFFINGVTLTRYEGLAILFASIGIVVLFSLLHNKNFRKTESDLFIFAPMASLGFALWTIYLAAIFGDPLYWMHYYAAPTTEVGTNTSITFAQNLSFLGAVWKYTISIVWMNGIVPVSFMLAGIFILVYKNIRKFNANSLPLLLPFSVFAFMTLTLMKNTPIKQPDLNLETILNTTTSYFGEFNIRYGLMITAFVSFFSLYLFNIRFKFFRIILVLFFCLQLYSYFDLKYTLIFQLPRGLHHALLQQSSTSQNDDVVWLKQNYDDGLIMVSALKHDPQMFKTGFDYKTYIHEGTNQYWKASIQDPTVYAKWVWMDYNNMDDQVTKYLRDSGVLMDAYDIVYDQKGLRIYKIKGVTRKSAEI